MKITAATQIAKVSLSKQQAGNFKKVLAQKNGSALTTALTQAIKNHNNSAESFKKLMLKTDLSPNKLLKVQYKTSQLLLREQMFCKTAELSANTFKSVIQMPI